MLALGAKPLLKSKECFLVHTIEAGRHGDGIVALHSLRWALAIVRYFSGTIVFSRRTVRSYICRSVGTPILKGGLRLSRSRITFWVM
jgi:hypothetical protein